MRRTETVINDPYDFDVGRRLKYLDDLKQINFAANRRLLGVERLSHDCTIGAETLAALDRPAQSTGNALRRCVAATSGCRHCGALLRFDLQPAGFRNRELREAVARCAGMLLDDYNAGQMTYDVRRLRGLIERIPHSQRYRLTADTEVGGDEGAYWRLVLRYCRQGNLQAVLDEQWHTLWGQETWSGDAGADGIAAGVRRQLLLPVVLPHFRMLPAVPHKDRTDDLQPRSWLGPP